MKVIKNIDETLFIEFDDENACTTISGVPVMFMSKKTMSSLCMGMIGALGKGARPLLYTSGYNAGCKSAPVVIKQWDCKNLDETLKATIQQFARYGWLLLKEVTLSEDGNEITCKVEKSFESLAYNGKSETSICYFLEGFICSYMEIVFNKENMVCEETTCQAQGDAFCQFVIKRKFWKE